jgi:hypothetical protein
MLFLELLPPVVEVFCRVDSLSKLTNDIGDVTPSFHGPSIMYKSFIQKHRKAHMRTMVLVYLPTKLGDFVRANVGKYSSTMEHTGRII